MLQSINCQTHLPRLADVAQRAEQNRVSGFSEHERLTCAKNWWRIDHNLCEPRAELIHDCFNLSHPDDTVRAASRPATGNHVQLAVADSLDCVIKFAFVGKRLEKSGLILG